MKDERGITLIELLISIAIAAMLSTVLFTVTFTYYSEVVKSQIASLLAIESQQVIRTVVDDVRVADSMATTNTITDPNGPPGGWVTSDPSDILIIESPAYDSARNVIYDPNTSLPYRNEFVYFRSGTNIYRRTLKNTSATNNIAVTTCPTVSSTCPADKKLSGYISSLSFTFLDANNATTASATLARSVLLSLNLSRKTFGQTITFNNSVQVTLRNN